MSLKKQLVALAVAFFLLYALAAILERRGRPAARSENLLSESAREKISKVSINRPGLSVVLEKQDGRWMLTSPLRDTADSVAARIEDALRETVVGSPISENRDKHALFDVTEASGTRVQVWVEGQDKPALDLVLGKDAGGYTDTYLRFEGTPQVFVAKNIPAYLFQRSADSFREPRAFPVPRVDITAMRFSNAKASYELNRSTGGWTLGNGKPVEETKVQPLLQSLSQWVAVNFARGDETAAQLGFANPALRVSLSISTRTVSGVVGNTIPAASGGAPLQRYVKVEGREPVLIMEDRVHQELLKLLAGLR